jgi:hypothetical protein
VEQYLALTMLRTQRESSMAAMMTPLLTRRGSCRLRMDAFIPASSSSAAELEPRADLEQEEASFLACWALLPGSLLAVCLLARRKTLPERDRDALKLSRGELGDAELDLDGPA